MVDFLKRNEQLRIISNDNFGLNFLDFQIESSHRNGLDVICVYIIVDSMVLMTKNL